MKKKFTNSIPTEFVVGQDVWYVGIGEIGKTTIESIQILYYMKGNPTYYEKPFASKEEAEQALINLKKNNVNISY